MPPLTEKYRPKRLSQILGQDKVIARIRALIGRRGYDGGELLWIEGPTGTGKTTLAKAIAHELGCGPWSIIEIDGDACGVDRVRDLPRELELTALDSRDGWKVVIVNEAHKMTARAVAAWLTLAERMPAKRLVIFTTIRTLTDRTLYGEENKTFGDRCKPFRLTNQGLATVFARLGHRIAAREGLNGRPAADYVRLVKRVGNSMRAVLQAIESGDMLADTE